MRSVDDLIAIVPYSVGLLIGTGRGGATLLVGSWCGEAMKEALVLEYWLVVAGGLRWGYGAWANLVRSPATGTPKRCGA